MLHILRYWASKGVDGFRCDMVHMVPVEFWDWAISNIRRSYPELIFIAEIYDVALYRPYINAGFDYLYDKVNLYDTLRAIECDGVSAACLTSCWQTVEGIGHNMLNFLENHDEQRFASPQYAGDPWRVVPSLVVSSMLNTGPMMIYGGRNSVRLRLTLRVIAVMTDVQPSSTIGAFRVSEDALIVDDAMESSRTAH